MSILSTVNTRNISTAFWGTHLLAPAGRNLSIFYAGTWDGVLNYTRESDIEQQETTEAQNPLDYKGADKEKSFSITVTVNKLATGHDPLSVYKDWARDLGKKSRFFVGLVPIDTSAYILQRVEMQYQNADIAVSGAAYRMTITLTFAEDTLLQTKQPQDAAKESAADIKPSKAAKQAEKANNSVFSENYQYKGK